MKIVIVLLVSLVASQFAFAGSGASHANTLPEYEGFCKYSSSNPALRGRVNIAGFVRENGYPSAKVRFIDDNLGIHLIVADQGAEDTDFYLFAYVYKSAAQRADLGLMGLRNSSVWSFISGAGHLNTLGATEKFSSIDLFLPDSTKPPESNLAVYCKVTRK